MIREVGGDTQETELRARSQLAKGYPGASEGAEGIEG